MSGQWMERETKKTDLLSVRLARISGCRRKRRYQIHVIEKRRKVLGLPWQQSVEVSKKKREE